MEELNKVIKDKNIELLIWDFDGVIFKMNWNYPNSVDYLLLEVFEAINKIDTTIIEDKEEFIIRQFPYPEINKVGIKHGIQKQNLVKKVLKKRELDALHLAEPNHEVIKFLRQTDLTSIIWSNNDSSVIKELVEKEGILPKFKDIIGLDKVLLSKPEREGFELIKSDFSKVDNSNILFIGDSIRSDQAAAISAGINFYHYSN